MGAAEMMKLFYMKNRLKKGFLVRFIKPPILLLLLSTVFALRAFYEASNLNIEQNKFESISAKVEASDEEMRSHPPAIRESTDNPAAHTPTILPRYAELAQQNPEFYGWIKIDNTMLDYPVMHTPNDPEKYLRLNFDCEYSVAGTIFMDFRCSTDSDNFILYGHNMKNQTMFGSILNYKDEAYWREHPIIRFDTLYEQREYEILAVFFDRVYNKNDDCFKYYNFIDAKDETEFTDAVQSFLEKSLYDTGVSAQYGDQLLTLSTCAYHTKDGRFAVLARKI